LGVIPYSIYSELQTDPRVSLAVPLAKGDNVGGAPIIGTDAAFFELRTEANAPPAFQLLAGRLFAVDFEAVLGSRAAAQLGLQPGDTFRPEHGFERGLEADVHTLVYTVVGILQPSNTPYDSAVYTTVQSVWAVHEADEEDEVPSALDALRVEGVAGASDRLTSILVRPVGFAEQNQLWQQFYNRADAQAAFPGQEIGGLFDLLAQGQRVLNLVGALVIGMALLTLFLAIYSLTLNRQREIAILRGLGGNRATIFNMVIFEALFILLIGSVIGRLLGYGLAWLIGAVYSAQSAIPVPIRLQAELEVLLWVLPLAGGLLAALIPAVNAYRVNVVDNLFST
jgi:putative ABC transport system permease protein